MLLMLFLPRPAAAESLTEGVQEIVSGLDTTALEATLTEDDPFEATLGLRTMERPMATR